MEEMRQAIERGRGIVPRSASPAFFNSTLDMDHLRNLVADTECDIKGVRQNHQALQAELKLIAADALDVCCAQPCTRARKVILPRYSRKSRN